MSGNKIGTSERLETFTFNDNTIEHLHRYALAIDLVKNKTVLDIASGEGYGSNLLAKHAIKVYGVDIDSIAVINAKKKYTAQNLEFKTGSAEEIPLADNSVDVVVSFETLEHHDKHHEMLREIKRILKSGGILIMSTPDKKYYSEAKDYKNPFHVKELDSGEFKELINSHFLNTCFYLQKMVRGSLIIPEVQATGFNFFDGSFNEIIAGELEPEYVVAIASDDALPNGNNNSFFRGNVIETEAAKTQNDLQKKIRDEGVEWIKKSWSFRVGNALLSPLRIFKK